MRKYILVGYDRKQHDTNITLSQMHIDIHDTIMIRIPTVLSVCLSLELDKLVLNMTVIKRIFKKD